MEDKHWFSVNNCPRFYCELAIIHVDYNLKQFAYTNFNAGVGRGMILLQKTLTDTGANICHKLVDIN
jgi:hypothetical protein